MSATTSSIPPLDRLVEMGDTAGLRSRLIDGVQLPPRGMELLVESLDPQAGLDPLLVDEIFGGPDSRQPFFVAPSAPPPGVKYQVKVMLLTSSKVDLDQAQGSLDTKLAKLNGELEHYDSVRQDLNLQYEFVRACSHRLDWDETQAGQLVHPYTALAWLAQSSEGTPFENVASWRDECEADLVHYVYAGDPASSCGVAMLRRESDLSDSRVAFSTTKVGCEIYVAHELGHVVGAVHDPQAADPDNADSGVRPYARPFRDCGSQGFYTLMAYNRCGAPLTLVEQWSCNGVTIPVNGTLRVIGSPEEDFCRAVADVLQFIVNFRGDPSSHPEPPTPAAPPCLQEGSLECTFLPLVTKR